MEKKQEILDRARRCAFEGKISIEQLDLILGQVEAIHILTARDVIEETYTKKFTPNLTAHEGGWIGVEDRLPRKNQRVWVNYEGYSDHSGVRWNRPGQWDCVWHGDRWSVESISRAQKRFDADVLEVTHWMPLPAPPKEGE